MLRLVRAEFTSGADRNEDGRLNFHVSGDEAAAHESSEAPGYVGAGEYGGADRL